MKPNLNTYVQIVGFIVLTFTAAGSYFKALGDIRLEIVRSMSAQRIEFMETVEKKYTTKEEFRSLQDIVGEVKGNFLTFQAQTLKKLFKVY